MGHTATITRADVIGQLLLYILHTYFPGLFAGQVKPHGSGGVGTDWSTSSVHTAYLVHIFQGFSLVKSNLTGRVGSDLIGQLLLHIQHTYFPGLFAGQVKPHGSGGVGSGQSPDPIREMF